MAPINYSKSNTRRYSSNQEKKVAKTFGGTQTANSGATAFSKGDVSLPNMLVECKTATSEKQSMAIKKDWLDKLSEEAFSMGKPYSVLVFNFGTSNPVNVPENYYIINEKLFKCLLNFLEPDNSAE